MRRRILYITLLLAVLGTLAWFFLHSREPRYQGRPLSYWLGLAGKDPDDQPMAEQSQTALRHIGTNAIPELLRLIAATDSPLKLKLIALAQKQHVINISFTPVEDKISAAEQGFEMLGPDAVPAAPALAEIFDRNVSPESQAAVIQVLGNIGPAAKETIPVLSRGTASKDMQTKLNSLKALGEVHGEPATVVPELTKCLADTDPAIQMIATWSLGQFGPEAKSAVPALERLVNSETTVPFVAFAGQSALSQIDSNAAAKTVIKLK